MPTLVPAGRASVRQAILHTRRGEITVVRTDILMPGGASGVDLARNRRENDGMVHPWCLRIKKPPGQGGFSSKLAQSTREQYKQDQ